MRNLLIVILDMNCDLKIMKHLLLFIHAHVSLGTNQVLLIAANTGKNNILYPRKDLQVKISKDGNVYKQFHDFDTQIEQTLPIAIGNRDPNSDHPKISGALALGLTCILN
jgi:hypothetical protein